MRTAGTSLQSVLSRAWEPKLLEQHRGVQGVLGLAPPGPPWEWGLVRGLSPSHQGRGRRGELAQIIYHAHVPWDRGRVLGVVSKHLLRTSTKRA